MPFGLGLGGWAYVPPYTNPYAGLVYPVWPWWGWGRAWGRGRGWGWMVPYWYAWW